LENKSTYKKLAFVSNKGAFCWYAVYTRPHHEKEVFRKLQEQKIQTYLPLQTKIRKWSDRKKKVTVPLFSCYLFVNITSREYFQVLNTPGVIRYVAFNGKAAVIPDKQIQLIKNMLEHEFDVTEVPENLYEGACISINAGPLTGMTGKLVDFCGKKRVIICIEEIYKSLLVSVPLNMLQLAG
jgi:transcription antitermination factor NusG